VAERRIPGITGRGPAWRRGGVTLLLLIGAEVAKWLVNIVAVLQFGWILATDAPNPRLTDFGRSLATWIAQAAAFATCASEQRPFPWGDWPA